MRLVDEHNEEVEEGDPGEIVVRGPNVFRKLLARGRRNRSGDARGVVAPATSRSQMNGYLFIVDRKKDLVIVSASTSTRGGGDVLFRHPKYCEAAVTGIASVQVRQ